MLAEMDQASDDARRCADAPPAAERGIVMAATGARYRAMAKVSAAGLRRHCPGLPIHLFTDDPASGGPFDRVVGLAQVWRRSKIDAMLAAPFERCLYLDVDTFVTADISDVFGLLDRFDVALAHDQERNGRHAAARWRKALPPSFPQFNSGVVAYRRTPAVLALLAAWRDAVRDNGQQRDQPALRELLWESDLRIATLPPEYNLMDMSSLLMMNAAAPAPRIIHHYRIHNRSRDVPTSVEELLGPAAGAAIGRMIASDRYLAEGRAVEPGGSRLLRSKRILQAWLMLDLGWRHLRRRLLGIGSPQPPGR